MLNDVAASVQLRRNRDFLIAGLGRCVSTFGDEIALIALTLRLQQTGARPYEIAVLLAAGVLPFVLLSRVVGRVVDSRDSRRIVVLASAVQMASCVPLIFARQVGVLAAFVFVLGAAAAFNQATWQALIPKVAGEQALARAISVLQSGTTVASIGAAALGGVLTSAFGTRVPLVIDAATFAVIGAAGLLVRTRRAPDAGRVQSRPFQGVSSAEWRSGWSVIKADPLVAPLVVGLAAFVLLVMMVNIVQVFLVRQTLHAGPAWYGALEASWMVGVVGGALVAGKVASDARRAGAVVLGAALVSGVLAGFAAVPDVIVLAPLSLLGGLGNGVVNTGASTLVMARTAERERGRAAAAVGAALNGASVASLAAGGLIASVLTPRQVYLVAGGLGLLVTAAVASRVRPAAASLRSVEGAPA